MNKRLISGWVILFLLLAGLLLNPSCSQAPKEETVTLEITPASGSSFDETDSQVLRCTSLTEEKDRIMAVVTKEKSAEIKALVFVNTEGQSSARIALVDLQAGEGDYDISGAVYRTVSLSSATEAINKGGLPYGDWLIGTMSQDELFPCCK